MPNDTTIIKLNTLEIDMLIYILDEVVSSQKIPEVINDEIRQELFAELDVAKILTDLKNKLGSEKFSQLEQDPEGGNPFIIKFTDTEIFDLKNGDYGDVESIIDNILTQIEQQTEVQ